MDIVANQEKPFGVGDRLASRLRALKVPLPRYSGFSAAVSVILLGCPKSVLLTLV